MKTLRENKGFTLIELLLVVVVIGLMLAVIVPRAWRANIDTKYGIVRQNCSEMASFASEWAESQLLAQDADINLTIKPYYDSLTNTTTGAWIPDTTNSNWAGTGQTISTNRTIGGVMASTPETSVRGVVPPEKALRNPFNGTDVFATANQPSGNVIPGAIAAGQAVDNSSGQSWTYYAFIFQGTESSTTALSSDTSFHAGMGNSSLAGLRNGIFMARHR